MSLDIKELLKLSVEERDVAIYNELRKVNCNDHIEKVTQGGTTLSYLSWSWAKDYMNSELPFTYEPRFFADENGVLHPYTFDKNTGYMVYTTITVLGVKKDMWLPVLDNHNQAMKDVPYKKQMTNRTLDILPATTFDINKALMRCYTKNLSMFGLGAYIYAGEDLPYIEKEYVTTEQINEMQKLGVKIDGVLTKFGITDINQLEKEQADFVISSKKNYLLKQQKEKSVDNGNKS